MKVCQYPYLLSTLKTDLVCFTSGTASNNVLMVVLKTVSDEYSDITFESSCKEKKHLLKVMCHKNFASLSK